MVCRSRSCGAGDLGPSVENCKVGVEFTGAVWRRIRVFHVGGMAWRSC